MEKKRSLSKSLRGKIGLQMLVVGLAPLLLVGVIVYLSMAAVQLNADESVEDSRVRLEEEVVSVDLGEEAADVATEVNLTGEERCADLGQWAKSPAVIAAAASSTSNDTAVNGFLLQQIAYCMLYYGSEFILTDASGTTLNSVSVLGVNTQALGVDQSAADWWLAAQNGLYQGDLVYDDALSMWVSDFAVPVVDPQTSVLVGVLKGNMVMPMELLVADVDERVPNGRILILDGEGNLIVDSGDLTRHLQDTVTYTDLEQAILDQVAQGETAGYEADGGLVAGYAYAGRDGSLYFPELTTYHGLDWIIIMEQPEEVAFAPLSPLETLESDLDSSTNSMIIVLVAVIIAVALGAMGMAVWLSRSITRPVTELSSIADRVSMGDLDVSVPRGSDDEIGDLAESFSRMVSSVKYLSQDEDEYKE